MTMPTDRLLTTLTTFAALAALATTARAQGVPPTDGAPADPYTMPPMAPSADAEAEAAPAADAKPKEPGRGDFVAGGQVRFPNGPDEMGTFASFNWVAVDARGKYYLLDSVTINGFMPLAIIKPDELAGAIDPKLIGGMVVTLEAKLPKMDVPFAPRAKDTEVGLTLSGAYMREGAMLLSEKDYPLFVGDFQPGLAAGLITKIKLGSVVDFKLLPQFVYQSGTMESLTGVQIPMSTILSVGSLLKLSADLGIYTGDDYAFGGDSGGRIALGAAVDVKIGPIITHLGTGFASLLTGGAYPTIGDSVYFDVNVKYAK